MKAPAVAVFLAAVASWAAWSAPQGLSTVSSVDWKRGALVVEISVPLSSSGTTSALPRLKAEAEERLDAGLSAAFLESMAPLPVDSLSTLGELAAADRTLLARLGGWKASGRKEDVRLSRDFSRLIARWTFPFYGDQGLVAVFNPSDPTPVRRRLGYVPSRTFSGLLIYAQGSLPAGGKAKEETVRPALFPRLLDEEMKPIFTREMCDPVFLKKWGMVGYAQSMDEGEILARAGVLPLRTVARAVFGKNGSDLVIPEDAVRQLFSRDENIALLRQGRILVVYDGPAGKAAAASPPPAAE